MNARDVDSDTGTTTPTGTPATSAYNGGIMDFEKLPKYARVVSMIGVPTIVLGFLLGQSAGWIPDVRSKEHDAILRHVQSMSIIQERTQELMIRNQQGQEVQLQALARMARALCLKAFTTQSERMACISGD